MQNAQRWIFLGALFGLLTVGLGAFGAHALEERLDAKQLATWETAVLYQALHALALVLLGLYQEAAGRGVWRPARIAGWAFCLGILLFSGSLYVYVLGGGHFWVFVTPVGGVTLMVGWLSWCAASLTKPSGSGSSGSGVNASSGAK